MVEDVFHIRCFFLQRKCPSVGHLSSHRETKWCAYVHHHVLSLCQGQIKSVHTCPRHGCGCTSVRTHARTDTKFETKSISPRFGLSPAGPRKVLHTFWIWKTWFLVCVHSASQTIAFYIKYKTHSYRNKHYFIKADVLFRGIASWQELQVPIHFWIHKTFGDCRNSWRVVMSVLVVSSLQKECHAWLIWLGINVSGCERPRMSWRRNLRVLTQEGNKHNLQNLYTVTQE